MKQLLFLLILLQSMLFSEELSLYNFRIHGNFCGANLPAVTTPDKTLELKILKTIRPIDNIDKACQQHDICYLYPSQGESKCDEQLIIDLQKIHHNLEDDSCTRLTKSIIYYFSIKTDNPFTVMDSDDSVGKKVREMPRVAFVNMMDSISMSSVMAMNYGYDKPVNYVFDSKNNSQRRKEIIQLFPSRFKECKLKTKVQ